MFKTLSKCTNRLALSASSSSPLSNCKLENFLFKKYSSAAVDASMRASFKVINPANKKLSYSVYPSDEHQLLCDTIGYRLETTAQEKPNKVCFKYSANQRSITFLEMKQRMNSLAQGLLELGFKKGDRLALLLPNIAEINFMIYAAASIGVITVLLNPAYQTIEIDYMLKKTKAKGIVILDNFKTLKHYDILCNICPELVNSTKGHLNSSKLPHLKHVIVANETLPSSHQNANHMWHFNQLDKLVTNKKHDLPHVDCDDDAFMLFTSGTTGNPKAATLTHHNLVNGAQFETCQPGLAEANQICCCPIPIFHCFGLVVGTLAPSVYGNTTVFPNFFPDTATTVKAIAQERCTSIKGSPIIFIDLLNYPQRQQFDLSSLQLMLVGASTVPKDLLIKIKEQLKFKHIIVGYGLTETSAGAILTSPFDAEKSEKWAFESIGRPLPFSEVKIIDNDGKTVECGTVGEICIRGYNIMKGYYDDPVKTKESIDENGWFKTGDVGMMDADGYTYFKTRAKELIIRGGVNIYPAEVESYIRTIPNVQDAYVFGVPDERSGEEVCAWIKLANADQKTTQETILEHCKGNIAYFKIPKYIKFVNSFPINATGKVQKFKMTQQMSEELKSIKK